jgi:hypothetical protein
MPVQLVLPHQFHATLQQVREPFGERQALREQVVAAREVDQGAEAKRFYERKKAKTNNVVAIKALARKLARACFHILKERKPFDVTRCFA